MAKFPAEDDDLSALPEPPPMPMEPPAVFVGDDDQAVRQINRRTSMVGKIVGFFFVVGAVVIGVIAWRATQSYEHRMDGVLAAGNKPTNEQMLAALREEYHKTDYDDVRERIVRNLGHFRDVQSVPLFIEALDEAGPVRRAAALALARVGSPAADRAKDKLLAVLPRTDERDRPQVVWALAVLRERRAVNEVVQAFTQGQLQGQPDFDPKVITDVIGPQRLGSPEMTGHPEMPVRVLVAAALSEAATPEVVEPLIRMLRDREPNVVRNAAAGLGRAGDPRAAQPLFDLLQRQPTMRAGILDAIRKTSGAPSIATLMNAAQDIPLKREFVRMLAETHDGRAADALFGVLTSEDLEIKKTAAAGLAELADPRVVPALLTLAQDNDDSTAEDALVALRKVSSPEAAAGLISMLGNAAFAHRRASIYRALGATGSEQAGAALMAGLDGDDIQSAATAVGELRYEPAYTKLRAKIRRPPNVDFSQPSVANEMIYRDRFIAVHAMGYFNHPEVADDLMRIVEDVQDDARLRDEAGATLALVADQGGWGRILAKVRDANADAETRRFYVQGAWRKPNPAVAGQLIDLIQQGTPPEIQRAAALAAGYAGDPANDARVTQLLEAPATRREAAFIVVLGGNEAQARRLVALFEDDRDLVEAIQVAVTSTDDDFFNVLTQEMFTSGQIWRRLRVAKILAEGQGNHHYGFIMSQLIGRLKSGYEGPNGVKPRYVRDQLFAALTGQDAGLRLTAAHALAGMGERGLLIRARDSGGPGAEEARLMLRDINRSGSSGTS